MFRYLYSYCRWNKPREVSELLRSNLGIDITQNNSMCIRIAISNKYESILRSLLKYYSERIPNPPTEERTQITKDLGETISLAYLTPEMMDIVIEYTPWLAEMAIMSCAGYDDVDTVKHLYPHFKKYTKSIIEEAIENEAYNVPGIIAQMQDTDHKKAMVYCDIGDELNRNGSYAKSYEFYEKSIEVDPEYIISYIHYANALVEKLSISFNMDLAVKAEESYKKAIEFNPKYSSAYKKLGILYQEMSENQTEDVLKEEYAIKAFKSYIDAIKNKSAKLKYEFVYQEIKHIAMHYSSNDEVRKVMEEDVEDIGLQELFASLGIGSTSDDESDISDTSETLREMSEEDLEYEETDMDTDLMGESVVVVDV